MGISGRVACSNFATDTFFLSMEGSKSRTLENVQVASLIDLLLLVNLVRSRAVDDMDAFGCHPVQHLHTASIDERYV